MSDEKRREELKAKINEQLDKFSIEDLERVAGGWGDPGDALYSLAEGAFHVAEKGTGKRCPYCGEIV